MMKSGVNFEEQDEDKEEDTEERMRKRLMTKKLQEKRGQYQNILVEIGEYRKF